MATRSRTGGREDQNAGGQHDPLAYDGQSLEMRRPDQGEQAGYRPESPENPESMEELQAAIEELTVAEEELRVQNEELAGMRASLDQERRRYRDLFESAPDGYLVTDLNGVVVEANLAAGNLLGITPDRLVHKPLASFVELGDRRGFRIRLLRLGEADAVADWEVRLQPRGRAPIYASLAVTPIQDSFGKPTGLRWLLRDISRAKQAEEQVLALNRDLELRVQERTSQLEEARERQSEYLRFITHDLRQPLTVLLGNAQLLQRLVPADGDPRLQSVASTLNHSATRLGNMIADLVDTVYIESGYWRLAKESVELRGWLTNTIDRAVSKPEQARISLDVAEEIVVSIDPARLERAVINLITNALKFSPPDTPVSVRALATSAEVTVTVTDRGIGMSSEETNHMFERLYRARRARTDTEGLGLGLYITRLIVEAHNGRIWVDSEENNGSTFSFTLPLA